MTTTSTSPPPVRRGPALGDVRARLRAVAAHYRDRSAWAHERRRAWTSPGTGVDYSYASVERHGAVFVHVPKTAGLAVTQALFGSAAGGHRTLATYAELYGPRLYRLFVCAIVRDPVTRLQSAYHYIRDGDHTEFERNLEFQRLLRDEYPTLERFVDGWLTRDAVHSTALVHLRPQAAYLRIGAELGPLDFIGRYERLDEDVREIGRRLGLGDVVLPRVNATPGPPRPPLSDRTRRAIAAAYDVDYRLLGYPRP